MKVALCFIISYEHILNKEEIWKEWIEHNKDIINVYFYYKSLQKIKSEWIIKHTIPPNYIYETSYYHVIPAYMSLMKFAITHDNTNQWFCFLTDSCCPIISPRKFRYLFYNNYHSSIMSWKKHWWNIYYHKRGNLALLPEELRLANDPWFILKRENVNNCLHFINNQPNLTKTICNGGLANESLFAIILYVYKELNDVICSVTHIADWNRQTNATSPHVFSNANDLDIKFIEQHLNENKFAMFIRKVSINFPDDVLKNYIYNYSKNSDDKLLMRMPVIFIYKRIYYIVQKYIFSYSISLMIILISFLFYIYYSHNEII